MISVQRKEALWRASLLQIYGRKLCYPESKKPCEKVVVLHHMSQNGKRKRWMPDRKHQVSLVLLLDPRPRWRNPQIHMELGQAQQRPKVRIGAVAFLLTKEYIASGYLWHEKWLPYYMLAVQNFNTAFLLYSMVCRYLRSCQRRTVLFPRQDFISCV